MVDAVPSVHLNAQRCTRADREKAARRAKDVFAVLGHLIEGERGAHFTDETRSGLGHKIMQPEAPRPENYLKAGGGGLCRFPRWGPSCEKGQGFL